MSKVTIVKIQGRETVWPLDEIHVSNYNPNMRTYYLRWNYHRNCAKTSSAQIFRIVSDLEMQGHLTHLALFHNPYEKEWCAVFTEKSLGGLAQSCWGVGLLEAQLRGLYNSMPNFELCHPWADYQLVAKGDYVYTLQR